MLEMPYPVSQVTVVGDADQPPELQLVDSGFLLNFPQGCCLYVLTGFLMALGEVPEAISGD